MGWLTWILIGAVAGFIASKIMGFKGTGCFTNIVIGIIGGVVGGFLVNLLGGAKITGFNPYSLVVATIGAVLFIWIVKKLRK